MLYGGELMAWNRQQPIIPIAKTITSGKVNILIPHRAETDYRQWRKWFMESLRKPDGTSYLEGRGYGIDNMRKYLASEAMKGDCEWFLWLDDDVLAPDNGIEVLLSAKLPFVCGTYWTKKGKGERSLSAWMKPPGANVDGYAPISNIQNARHIQVDVIGMGFALTHRSLFEGLSYPWFKYGGDDGQMAPSEDFYFCEKVAKEKGIKPVVDMECHCQHIGTFIIDKDGEFGTLGV